MGQLLLSRMSTLCRQRLSKRSGHRSAHRSIRLSRLTLLFRSGTSRSGSEPVAGLPAQLIVRHARVLIAGYPPTVHLRAIRKKFWKNVAKNFPLNAVRVRALRAAGYEVGHSVFLGAELHITDSLHSDSCSLSIGDRVAIAPRVMIIISSHPNRSRLLAEVGAVKGQVTICNDAYWRWRYPAAERDRGRTSNRRGRFDRYEGCSTANSRRWQPCATSEISCKVIVELNIDDPRWLEFVSTTDGATAFHHPAWARLLMDTYGYRAFAVAVVDRAGNIGAGLPVMDVDPPLRSRRLVSLPVHGCVLPTQSASRGSGRVGSRSRRRAGTPGSAGVQDRSLVSTPETRVSSAAGVIHTLQLTAGATAIRNGFKSTVRQDIAKASRFRLSIRRATTPGDVADTFFRLQLRTRRRLGVPMQPRRYFVELWRRILEPGLGFCLIAESERRPVASGIFLAWRSTLIHKYGASDERFLNLRPNHFLLWEAIRWGAENGYDVFDFGRTDHGQDGLRRFKSSWGAREDPLLYSSLGDP